MKSPPVARAIVRLLADPGDREFLLRDLTDRFLEMAQTEGRRAAQRWFWCQALSAVPWAFRRDLDRLRLHSWAGVLGEVRRAFRTLWRSPLYAVGVSGTLGLGLAAATITFAVAWLRDRDALASIESDARGPGGNAQGRVIDPAAGA